MTDRARVRGANTDLDLLFNQVEALYELASDPERAADRDRVYDFSIRWGTMLSGRLPRLAHYYDRGELDGDEAARYEALRDRLRDALPLMRHLGVARPEVPLDGPGDR